MVIYSPLNISRSQIDSTRAVLMHNQSMPNFDIRLEQIRILPKPVFTPEGSLIHEDWWHLHEYYNTSQLQPNQNIPDYEALLPTIMIQNGCHGPWIHRWIEEESLQQDLISIQNKLQPINQLEYYTDSLLSLTQCSSIMSHYTSDIRVIEINYGI